MQLPFITGESFVPLPHGNGQYVAALQNRKGELDALATASAETWSRLAPLIHIVGPKNPKDQLRIATVRGWIKRVAAAVGDHPCFLDILRLNPTYPTAMTGGQQRPVLACLFEAARNRGVQFVPVLPVDHKQAHADLVCAATLVDGRGVALRYAVLGTVPPAGRSPATLVADALRTLDREPADADLLLDLGWLSPEIDVDAGDLVKLMGEMISIGAWRSVVLMGTSMPATLSCVREGEIGLLPRREWQLWKEIRRAGCKRVPTYGDYAIQHPKPPHDPGGPGMRANIRYTVDHETVVARGVGAVMLEGNEQYRELCRKLVSRTDFTGPSYSWGDKVIHDCAVGLMAPGAQGLWRGAGTSHHLRFVTQQLAS
jgi:hypothetical protein